MTAYLTQDHDTSSFGKTTIIATTEWEGESFRDRPEKNGVNINKKRSPV